MSDVLHPVDRPDLGVVTVDRPAHDVPTARAVYGLPSVDVRSLLVQNGWHNVPGTDSWVDPTTRAPSSTRDAAIAQCCRSGQPVEHAVAIVNAALGIDT